jgi:ABC-2 type transport system permease protein
LKPLRIAANSLRRFYRDRTAVFFTIAFPIVIILLIGTATSRFADSALPVGVVGGTTGALDTDLRGALEANSRIALETFGDTETLAKAVRRGAVAAGVVIPDNYDAGLRAGEIVSVELLFDQTRSAPLVVRSAVGEVIASHGGELQAASFATTHSGGTFDENLAAAREGAPQLSEVALGVEVETVGSRSEPQATLDPGIGYQTPSMLVLFVFITSLTGASLLIQSRQLKVTERMFGTPTSARTILAGESLSRFVIAGTQAVIIFLAGLLLFGVEWGSPIGALAVIVLFVLVGASFGMLIGTIFSKPEQAGAIGPPVGIAMGMLGGCMWPLEIVPDAMRIAGHAFPHAWAMDAWIELIGRGGGITDIATELAVLAAFVAVVFPLAAWRLRRVLVD